MRPILPQVMALILTVSILSMSVQAKSSVSCGTKATHKATAKKHPQGSRSDTSTSSQWKSDAKLLAQLQPEQQFGAYSMRLPIGYTVEEHDTSSETARITAYFVKGPQRANGTFPVIIVVVGSMNSGYTTGSADALLGSNAVLNGKSDLTKSDRQNGQANGLPLVRQYFKYRFKPGTDLWMHGLHYATTDGQTDALIAALDAEPYHKTSLPLAEAAILTLHKTP